MGPAGIHFKMLNSRKGPAVRGPRAQADRDLYRQAMSQELRRTPNLELFEGTNCSRSIRAAWVGTLWLTSV